MPLHSISKYLQASLLALLLCISPRVHAVAYCALRDPVQAIQSFYPGFSSYRSYVGEVERDLRQVLEERLPYPLHFNEFGKHTLYVAFRGDQAAGMVHARTEKGDWGLDEIIWSFNMDLTVRDFLFQRSRSGWRSELQKPVFKALLKGKDFDQLLQLLTADGSALARHHPGLPQDAERLAATVVRSALKTIVVTEYVWSEQLPTSHRAGRSSAMSRGPSPGKRTMSIRSYIIWVFTGTVTFGLCIAGYFSWSAQTLQRMQYEVTGQSLALRELRHFGEQLDLLLVSSDLALGSGETYTAQIAVDLSRKQGQLIDSIALNTTLPYDSALLDRIGNLLAALERQIEAQDSVAADHHDQGRNGLLARFDATSGEIVTLFEQVLRMRRGMPNK